MHTSGGGKLIGIGAAMVIAGTVLIIRRPNKHLPPGDDSPGARLVGGFVMIAFGVIVGYVGIDLLTSAR